MFVLVIETTSGLTSILGVVIEIGYVRGVRMALMEEMRGGHKLIKCSTFGKKERGK